MPTHLMNALPKRLLAAALPTSMSLVLCFAACGDELQAGRDVGVQETGVDVSVELGVSFGVTDDTGFLDWGTIDWGATSDTRRSDAARPTEPTFGEACHENFDCFLGEVCVERDPPEPGYCSLLACVDQDDCPSDLDALYCCSNRGPYRGCFREPNGTACGDESGVSGDDCSAGGESDCLPEDECIQWYDRHICAAECRLARGEWACPRGQWCIPTGGYAGLCVPEGDIETRESCFDTPSQCDSGAICEGYWGDYPSPYAFCTDLCTQNEHCREGVEWCRLYPQQTYGTCQLIGESGLWTPCTEDRWQCGEGLVCAGDGSRYARCTGLCEEDAECTDEHFFCLIYDEETGRGLCAPRAGRPVGAACGDNPWSCGEGGFCLNGWQGGHNADAYCLRTCDPEDTTSCPSSFACLDFGEVGAYCLADGAVDIDEPCDGPMDCVGGSACVFERIDQPGFCAALCGGDGQFSDDSCGTEGWCTGTTDAVGVCLTSTGSRAAGEACDDDPQTCAEGLVCAGTPNAFCLPECTDDPTSCPAGMYCTDFSRDDEARRYCFPAGNRDIGQACASTDDCVEDAFCAFTEESGKGICTVLCDDDPCPDDYWCLRTTAFAFCLPEGEAPAGSACSDYRFSCVPDTLCLFNDTEHAFCAADCGGFASTCGPEQECQFIGWGINSCVGVGAAQAGDSCASDVTSCAPGNLCLSAGTPDAVCAASCTYDRDICPDSEQCFFFPSGVAICTPPDFTGSDLPLRGRPLK